jgi:hypothetical protein
MKFEPAVFEIARVVVALYADQESVAMQAPVSVSMVFRLAIYRGLVVYETLNPCVTQIDATRFLKHAGRGAKLDESWEKRTLNLTPAMLDRAARVGLHRNESRSAALRHLVSLGFPVLIFEARRGVVL